MKRSSLFLLFLLLFSCRASIEKGVDEALSSVNISLQDKPKSLNTSYSIDNGRKASKYEFTVSREDAETIKKNIQGRSCYTDEFEITNAIEDYDPLDGSTGEVANKVNNGYVYVQNKADGSRHKLYLDTTDYSLYFKESSSIL